MASEPTASESGHGQVPSQCDHEVPETRRAEGLPPAFVAPPADRTHRDRGVACRRRVRGLQGLPALRRAAAHRARLPGRDRGTTRYRSTSGRPRTRRPSPASPSARACRGRALTIAYATALQESKLENLSYGDLDSVGIFQQRPSEGWGSATQLQDPAYAATAFFNALVKVPNYTTLPVYQAAQDVQRSADGYAYEQYAQTGAALAAYFTATPHAVTCWYNPATQASNLGVCAKLNLKAAGSGLTDAFGQPGAGQAVRAISTARTGASGTFKVAAGSGWAVANWLVANAELLRNHPGAATPGTSGRPG